MGWRAPPAKPWIMRKKNEALDVPDKAAEQRTQGKKGHGENKVALPSEEPAEPAGHGDDDGVRCQIGRNGPSRFVNSRRKASPDMIERDIDNRRVNDDHERGQHHGEGDEPLVSFRNHIFATASQPLFVYDDRGLHGHSDPEFMLRIRPLLQNDLDGNPLDDFHEIARGILRGK